MNVSTQYRLLVIDDDERLRDLLKTYLCENNFDVDTAKNAIQAKRMILEKTFDLLIMDITMPGQDGLSLTKELRQSTDVPIFLLTARGDSNDRITAFENGADDYLSKPFEPKELLLRIHSILKHYPKIQPDIIKLGAWKFNKESQIMCHNEQGDIKLSHNEVKFLNLISQEKEFYISRDKLSQAFKVDYFSRSLDVLLARLRKKLGDDPKNPDFIKTIRGKGYQLNVLQMND